MGADGQDEYSCLEGCGDLSFSDIKAAFSAAIGVTNNADESAFIVLYSDDANAARKVLPGGSELITTHVDGSYHVVVAGSGSELGSYQNSLTLLRSATHDLHANRDDEAKAGAATARAATAKQNLEGLFFAGAALASCTGTVKFPSTIAPSPQPIHLTASVTKSGSTWAATCPSTSP